MGTVNVSESEKMSNQTNGGAIQLLQPEITALVQRVGAMGRDFEEKYKQFSQDQADFELQKNQFQESIKVEQLKLKEEADKNGHIITWEKDVLRKEKEEFEKALSCGAEIASRQEPVTVEVGGEKFRTELQTLAKCQGSLFPNLVSPLQNRKVKGDPYIFIDRDGKHFRFILNYLRDGAKVMRWSAMRNPDHWTLNEILDEVKYYQIYGLERLIERKIASLREKVSFNQFKEKYFLSETPPLVPLTRSWKTTRGIDVLSANLSTIIFSNIEFCHPVIFKNCCMKSVQFDGCHFRSAMIFENVELSSKFFHCKQPNDLVFKGTDTSGIEIIPIPEGK